MERILSKIILSKITVVTRSNYPIGSIFNVTPAEDGALELLPSSNRPGQTGVRDPEIPTNCKHSIISTHFTEFTNDSPKSSNLVMIFV